MSYFVPLTASITILKDIPSYKKHADSSRFWLASKYEVGKGQESYDKQYLRDWLTSNGVNGKPGVEMPVDIAENTSHKYLEAYELLTGKKWGCS